MGNQAEALAAFHGGTGHLLDPRDDV